MHVLRVRHQVTETVVDWHILPTGPATHLPTKRDGLNSLDTWPSHPSAVVKWDNGANPTDHGGDLSQTPLQER